MSSWTQIADRCRFLQVSELLLDTSGGTVRNKQPRVSEDVDML
jgi:hypothetical protein